MVRQGSPQVARGITAKLFFACVLLSAAFVGFGYWAVVKITLGVAERVALAQEQSSSITYPISELGNCDSAASCKTYCDAPEHTDECVAFGKVHSLIPPEHGLALAALLAGEGPDGCRTPTACRIYCADPVNADTCLAFAERFNLVPKEIVEHARRGLSLLRSGGPGGCNSVQSCRQYCDTPKHFGECVEYSERNGLIDLDKAAKIKRLGPDFMGPGNCKGPEECRQYCQDPEHLNECITFGEQHGFLTREEVKYEKKFESGPGDCKGEKDCVDYCSVKEHVKECIDFGEREGLMTREDAERARLFADTPGPGNCRGEECRAYCEDIAHAQECLGFAEKHGFISRQDAGIAREFLGKFTSGPGNCQGFVACQRYCETPEHFDACREFAKDHNLLPPPAIGEMKRAQELRSAAFSGEGPGNCKSPDECRAYCADPAHLELCVTWGLEHGHLSPEQANQIIQNLQQGLAFRSGGGPGGCETPKECYQYCFEHPVECPNFHTLPPGVTSPSRGETYPVPPPIYSTQIYTQYPHTFESGPCQGLSDTECYRVCTSSNDQCRQCHDAYGFSLDKCPITSTQTYTYSPPPTFTYTATPPSSTSGCFSIESCISYCPAHTTDPACVAFYQSQIVTPPPTIESTPIPTTTYSGGFTSGPCVGLTSEQCSSYCSAHCTECATAYGYVCSTITNTLTSTETVSSTTAGCYSSDSCVTYCPTHLTETTCTSFYQSWCPSRTSDPTCLILYPNGITSTTPTTSSGFTSGPCVGLTSEQCNTYCSTRCQECKDAYGYQCTTTGASVSATPGNCATPDACRAYCVDSRHQEECRQYGYQYPAQQGFFASLVATITEGLSTFANFLVKLFT